MSEPRHMYIIDASIFIFKYYFSMPSHFFALNGRPTETVYGYGRWLKKFLAEVSPHHVVACFDESLGTCFRNDIYPAYKQSRSLPDDDLSFQLLACKRITELLGVSCYASDRFEADDLIASFARYCSQHLIAYTILSRDKDLVQALREENSGMWNFPENRRRSKRELERDLGFMAHQMPSFLALVGDVSDDIPGVPGIGKKTAAALLGLYESWGDIKSNLGQLDTHPLRAAKSVKQSLVEYSGQIDLALKLSTLDSQALDVNWEASARRAPDTQSLAELSQGLGFAKLFSSAG